MNYHAKSVRRSLRLWSALCLSLSITGFAQAQSPQIWYVDASAEPGGTGTDSWDNAFTDLQGALFEASESEGSDEIWVAAGTYYPAGPGNQTISFNLQNDVALFGGFLGNAPGGGETERSQRDPEANETIMSGDIDLDGYGVPDTGNSWHVVRAQGVDNTAVLNGFTISWGSAENLGLPGSGSGHGGGASATSALHASIPATPASRRPMDST